MTTVWGQLLICCLSSPLCPILSFAFLPLGKKWQFFILTANLNIDRKALGFVFCILLINSSFRLFTQFCSVLLSFAQFCSVLLSFAQFFWVLLSFAQVCSVLLSFAQFYWVLLSFAQFYSVFLSSTQFYSVLLSFNHFYSVLLSFAQFLIIFFKIFSVFLSST